MILYTLKDNGYIDIKNVSDLANKSVYVNTTNRCSCSCTFCLRQTKKMMQDNTLWLEREPSVEEIISEFDKYDASLFKEVVFCGFGEPLIRHDDIMRIAKYLKDKYVNIKIRINTNGLSSLSNKRDITPEFKGLIDTISISLNTSNKEEYLKLTRSSFGIDSFDEMLSFASKCKNYVDNVVLTVVDIIGQKDIDECQKIADKIGVALRVRPFEK